MKPDRQILLICVIFFSAILGYEVSSTFVSLFLSKKGFGAFLIGSIVSLWPVFVILFSPLAGILSDKFGRKFFISVGTVLYSLFGIFCFIENFYPAFILLGIGNAFLWTVGRAFVFDVARRRKIKEVGYFFGSAVAGSLLGAPLSGFFVEILGFKNTFLAGAGIASISFLFSLFLVEPKHKKLVEISKPSLEIKSHTLIVLTCAALISFSPVAAKIFLPILLDYLNFKPFIIGILFFITKISLLLSQFIIPKFKVNEIELIKTGSLIHSSGYLILFFSTILPEFLISSFLSGIGYGLSFLVVQTFISNLSKNYGKISGFFEVAVNIGQLLGSFASGAFVEVFGIRNLFLLISVFSLIPAIAFHKFKKNFNN